MSPKTPTEAIARINTFLRESGLDAHLSADEIVERIRTSPDDPKESARYFSRFITELWGMVAPQYQEELLETLNEAWNALPHDCLGGRSPSELVAEQGGLQEVDEAKLVDEMRARFTSLYAHARARAKREHERLGGTEAEFAELERAINAVRSSEEELQLGEVIMRQVFAILIREVRAPENVEVAEPLMRELQRMTNHSFFEEEQTVGSPLIFKCFEALMVLEGPPLRIDLFNLIAHLDETHALIDDLAQESANAREPLSHERAVSIAHHVFDWLVIEETRLVEDYTPHEAATLTLGIVNRLHAVITGEKEFFGPSRDLSARGGWPSIQRFTGAVRSTTTDVLYVVADPHMLIIDPCSYPDNWRARFAKLAPDLPVDEPGEDERGIPSPFPFT
ncbi:hypothetical protein GVX82_02035 [Patescibacteria group bacterium]|jgi:hypothetical protein|nr:hypothetical protein [Patescibacteria group bacterium]